MPPWQTDACWPRSTMQTTYMHQQEHLMGHTLPQAPSPCTLLQDPGTQQQQHACSASLSMPGWKWWCRRLDRRPNMVTWPWVGHGTHPGSFAKLGNAQHTSLALCGNPTACTVLPTQGYSCKTTAAHPAGWQPKQKNIAGSRALPGNGEHTHHPNHAAHCSTQPPDGN